MACNILISRGFCGSENVNAAYVHVHVATAQQPVNGTIGNYFRAFRYCANPAGGSVGI